MNLLEHNVHDNELQKEKNEMDCYQQVNQSVIDKNKFETSADESNDDCNADDNILQFLQMMVQSTLEDSINDCINQDFEELNDENVDSSNPLKQIYESDSEVNDTKDEVNERHIDVADSTKQGNQVGMSDLNDTESVCDEEDSYGRARADNTNQLKQDDKPILKNERDDKLIKLQNKAMADKEDLLAHQKQKKVYKKNTIELPAQKKDDINEEGLFIDKAEKMPYTTVTKNGNVEEMNDHLKQKDRKDSSDDQSHQKEKIVLGDNRTELNVQNIDNLTESIENISDVTIYDFIEQHMKDSTFKKTSTNEDQKRVKSSSIKHYVDEYLNFVGMQTEVKRNLEVKNTLEMLTHSDTKTIKNKPTHDVHTTGDKGRGSSDSLVVNLHSKSMTRFRCCICFKSYASEEKLKFHLYSHVMDKHLSCFMCSTRFSDKKTLENHKYIIHRPYVCDLCSKRFVTMKTLRCHVKRHLFGNQTKCNLHTQYLAKKCDLLDDMEKEQTGNNKYNQDIYNNVDDKIKESLADDECGLLELANVNANESHPEEFPKCITNGSNSQNLPECKSFERLSSEINEEASNSYESLDMINQASDNGYSQEVEEFPTSTCNLINSQEMPTEASDLSHSMEIPKQTSNNIHSHDLSNCEVKKEQIVDEFQEIQTQPNGSFRYCLQRHMYQPHDCLPFKCSLCKRGFKRREGLKVHVKNTHGLKSFQCNLCQKYFGLENTLKIHKIYYCAKKIPCSFCEKRFTSVDVLFKHVKKDHPNKLKKYHKNIFLEVKNLMIKNQSLAVDTGPDCETEYQPKSLTESDDNPPNEIVTLDSDKLINVDFDKIVPEESNESKNTQSSGTVCTEHESDYFDRSRKRSETEGAYQQSQTTPAEGNVTQALKKNKINKCTKCCKVYSNPRSLQKHMSAHLKRRRMFLCFTCNKSFIRNDALKRHCLRYGHRKGALCCLICDKRFFTQQSLEQHEKVHPNMGGYLCSKCGITCKYEFEYYNHVRSKHPVKSKADVVFNATRSKEFETNIEELLKESLTMGILFEEKGADKSDKDCLVEEDCAVNETMTEIKEKLKKSGSVEAEVDNQETRQVDNGNKIAHIENRQTEVETKPKDDMAKSNFTCKICNKSISTERNIIRHMTSHTYNMLFECSVCGKGFARLDHLKVHRLNMHDTEQKSFKCGVCEKTFATNTILKKHEEIHSDIKKYECKTCMITFRIKFDLTKHLRRVHPDIEIKYDCITSSKKSDEVMLEQTEGVDNIKENEKTDDNICLINEEVQNSNANSVAKGDTPAINMELNEIDLELKLKERQRVRLQGKQKESNSKKSCNICQKKFSSSYCLQRHMYVHSDKLPYTCFVCKKGFTRLDRLKSHVKNIHTGGKLFGCGLCKRTFASNEYLKKHELIHLNIKRFHCKICMKKFKRKWDLMIHSKRFHPDIEIQYGDLMTPEEVMSEEQAEGVDRIKVDDNIDDDNCLNNKEVENSNAEVVVMNVTPEVDNRSSIDDKHMKLQEKQRETDSGKSCKICHKTFRSSCNLRRHMYSHSDKLPFTCSVCNRGFARKDNMEIHVKNMHTGEKLFECEVCKKTFATRNYLEYHNQIHTNTRNFQCRVCDKSYKTKRDRDRHIKWKHPETLKPLAKMRLSEYSNVESDVIDIDVRDIDETHFSLSNKIEDEAVELNKCDNIGNKEHNRENKDRAINVHNKSISDQIVNIEHVIKFKDRTNNVHNKSNSDMNNSFSKYTEVDANMTEGEAERRKDVNDKSELMPMQNQNVSNEDETSRCKMDAEKSENKKFESMEKHEATNSKEKFSCSKCQKVFANKYGLKRHMIMHSEILPYACSVCGKRFHRKDALNLHTISAHSGTKDFTCEVCHKAFVSKHNLREHQERHLSLKQYRCQFCKKNFKTQGDLLKHIHRMHPEKNANYTPDQRYPCSFCGKFSKFKGDVIKHVLRMHPEKLAEYKSIKQ